MYNSSEYIQLSQVCSTKTVAVLDPNEGLTVLYLGSIITEFAWEEKSSF